MTTTARTTASYEPARTSLGGFDAELARLKEQAALTAGTELAALHRAGVRDGHRVLDLGCGSGAFTRRLRAALPASQVLGGDADPRLLRHAGDGVLRLDARRLPLATGSVDVILVRYVAQHLAPADRARVWREAARVLAPGGVLVVVDVDDARWGRVTPVDPALQAVFRRLAARRAAAPAVTGGDRFVVRAVPDELRSAGFADVAALTARCTSEDRPLPDFGVHLGPQRYLRELSEGVLSTTELAAVAVGWRRLLADPAAAVELDVHLVRAEQRISPTERTHE